MFRHFCQSIYLESGRDGKVLSISVIKQKEPKGIEPVACLWIPNSAKNTLTAGIEPATSRLTVSRSANWAMREFASAYYWILQYSLAGNAGLVPSDSSLQFAFFNCFYDLCRKLTYRNLFNCSCNTGEVKKCTIDDCRTEESLWPIFSCKHRSN